ncbi:hypothetical protein AB0M43_39225 [Longispora sp. NPDC051575]|uniref:hypothetical protein n=1 Tax=Longispora sp. NPDC051575 TaxID=3154943 RepID=UPI003426ABD5
MAFHHDDLIDHGRLLEIGSAVSNEPVGFGVRGQDVGQSGVLTARAYGESIGPGQPSGCTTVAILASLSAVGAAEMCVTPQLVSIGVDGLHPGILYTTMMGHSAGR